MRTTQLLAAAILAAAAVPALAAECGAQRDFLADKDPVMPAIRPADCARVLPDAAALAWPSLAGSPSYIVTLTHPDGRVEVLPTQTSALSWNQDLPPGTYGWRVSVAGSSRLVGEERTFTVDAPGA